MKKLCLLLLAVMLSFNANAETKKDFFAGVRQKTAEIVRKVVEDYNSKKAEFEAKVRADAKANGEALSEEEITARVNAMLMEFYKAEEEKAKSLEQDIVEVESSSVE